MTRAFVLLSGGVDSAVSLHEALNHHQHVEAIFFDYGQQTSKIERNNALEQTEEAGIPFHTSDYRRIFKQFAEGTVENRDYDHNQTLVEGHSVGYVPQRNLHFLTTAAAIAEHNTPTSEEIVLYLGAQWGDRDAYPDCRPDFINSAQASLNESTDQHTIKVEAPLIDLSKTEVLERGEELGVNWELTFSCYNDSDGNPCGECPACVERKEAFERAGFQDPLIN